MFKTIMKTVKQEKTKSSLSEQQDITQIPKIEEKQFNINFNRQIFEYLPYQIPNSIDAIFYFKEILTQQQQEYLMKEIYNQPKRWVDLPHSNRRVQKYGGDVKEEGLINVEKFPEFLTQLSNLCFLDDNTLNINHALINEYAPGIGIHPHFDGPLYHNFVNIFSINSTCIFKFKKQDESLKLFVEPGSLLIFTKQAYTEWLHGIDYHHDDTILLNIKENQVCHTDLINFHQTLFYQNLQKAENIIEYLNNQPNYELCQIQNNNQYTHSLIIRRLLRVSITLRHVPYNRK
ncbi:unnamed protein product [Paramecium primaurelia]|uniref:Fe2OG dioxygenase domain-containing protein n=1 Tax=Paramecium primaurelia TaxID=5886 RepID=A0A8S1KB46_PARPR|nr:unnamed protein product [Paramecium primaurelia]